MHPHEKNTANSHAMVVVDFDDTCTSQDTIGLLMDKAVEGRLASVGHADAGLPALLTVSRAIRCPGDLGSARMKMTVGASLIRSCLQANYVARQKALLAQILPPAGTQAGGFPPAAMHPPRLDRVGLGVFLEKLSDFDEEMNRVAVEKGALAGLSMDQVCVCGGHEGRYMALV